MVPKRRSIYKCNESFSNSILKFGNFFGENENIHVYIYIFWKTFSQKNNAPNLVTSYLNQNFMETTLCGTSNK